MKTILLATSALVASAGFAMADGHIAFSGKAAAGIASAGGEDPMVYSGLDLGVSMSGSSDNGLDFGASFNMDVASQEFDFGSDAFDGATGGPSFGNVYISGGGVTVTFDNGGIGGLYDGDDDHDLSIAYASGGVSVTLTHDLDGSNYDESCERGEDAPTDCDDDDSGSQTDFKVAYTGGAISASVAGNDDDDMVANVGWSQDALSVGLEFDMPQSGDDVITATVGYTTGPISLEISADDNDDWDFSATYAENGVSVTVSTDEEDAWAIEGSVDAGGGLSIGAGINEAESYYLGATMSF